MRRHHRSRLYEPQLSRPYISPASDSNVSSLPDKGLSRLNCNAELRQCWYFPELSAGAEAAGLKQEETLIGRVEIPVLQSNLHASEGDTGTRSEKRNVSLCGAPFTSQRHAEFPSVGLAGAAAFISAFYVHWYIH